MFPNFQWLDLIRVVALAPYVFIGPLLIKFYRHGGMPTYIAAATVVSFVATLANVVAYVFFPAPDWIGWAWCGLCIGVGFTVMLRSLWENRTKMMLRRYLIFGPRMDGLLPQEAALFEQAEREALAGIKFDAAAGLEDVRRRAEAIPDDLLRPATPHGPGASAASPDAPPATRRLRSALPASPTAADPEEQPG